MSGICGIWTRNPGSKRLSCTVQAGLDAMAHRGADGFSIYPDRNIALGHCLLDTGCNGMFVDEAGYAISFDGRLDNRDELATTLREADVALPDIDRMRDEAFLLLAYRHFGSSLPEHLRGDFAIAIWNTAQQVLFLCRDHFGVRPLFYTRTEQDIHFASEIKSLRTMVGNRCFTVRDKAITGFVNGHLDATEPGCTFYAEVYRLLPGHWAQISAGGMKINRYWSLDPSHPIHHGDTGAKFRKLLAQAIDRRVRTTASVGALLSGGLDSSAIVSMIGARTTRAVPATVKIFSMTFPDNAVEDETPYIDAVLDAYQLDGTRIEVSSVTAFKDLDTIIGEQDHPPPAPNASTFRHFLHDVAARGKARVVLHGHGGDEVVSHGTGLLFDLAESGRWLRLWRELGKSEDILGRRSSNFPGLLRRSARSSLRRIAARWLKPRRFLARDAVRFAPDGRARGHAQAQHLRDLTAPLFAHALEVTDHEAAAAGIELRMPFLDVDLVSFCLAVPGEEKWVAGYPRALMRRALAGILPEVVAHRRDKFNFAEHLRPSMLQDHAALVEDALHAKAGWLAPYADIGDLRAKWRSFRESRTIDGLALMQLWRAVALSRWLQLESNQRAAAATHALEPAE